MKGGWHQVERAQQLMWDQTRTEVAARLNRVARGETTASAQMVRCLQTFLAAEVRS